MGGRGKSKHFAASPHHIMLHRRGILPSAHATPSIFDGKEQRNDLGIASC